MIKYLLISIIFISQSFAVQKIGFISSDLIREKFPEAKRAEQRIQSNVEQWKRELENYDIRIENIELDLKKNRLIWTPKEINDKESELLMLKKEKLNLSQSTFETGGKYDQLVKEVWQPIESKIFAAVSEIAADQDYDFILDKSTSPIPYVNYKYDITLSVLKKLGVNVEEMEKELKKKIDTDPRNQKKEVKTVERTSTRGSRRVVPKKELTPEAKPNPADLLPPNPQDPAPQLPVEPIPPQEEEEEGGG